MQTAFRRWAQIARRIGVTALLVPALTRPAAAQTPGERKWEVEFHAGALLASNPSGGTASVPGPGEQFITGLNCQACPASRRVSSWYFGDGTTLANQVATSPPFFLTVQTRAVPLDPVLSAMLTERPGGAGFGARVGRALGHRLTAEMNIDYSPASLEITSAARAGIEASRAAFIATWDQLLRTGPFGLRSVTSTADVRDGNGGQLLVTGALSINLVTTGALIPYVTAGAGLISNLGSSPAATLAGQYQFVIGNISPISESDTVTVRDDRPDRSFVGVFGGGVRWHLSPRWGVRADVRDHAYTNQGGTAIDATPATVFATPPTYIFSATSPSIQFSNQPTVPSSLSGVSLKSVPTFKGSGVQNRIGLTAGVFWRF